MRKLASIQEIVAIEAIPNADRIEVAQVLGWKCVVEKGKFEVGDVIVYFEIDSFLPVREEFEFLRKSCYKKLPDGTEGFRIKTIRLRKQISQGLVFSLKELKIGADKDTVGEDISKALGVTKYEPPIPACIAGTVKGHFPSFMPKTDETRVQLLQNVLTRHKGTKCYITEKVDGSSATYFVKDGEFGVCSRNLELLETEGNAFWKYAREADLENKMRSLGKNIAFQGELVGFGVQNNALKMNDRKVLFFQIFDIDAYKYLDLNEFMEIILRLDLFSVPILDTDFTLIDNIDELVKLSVGKSFINPNAWREGIVIRPLKETLDMGMAVGIGIGGSGRLSCKAVNPEYLLVSDS